MTEKRTSDRKRRADNNDGSIYSDSQGRWHTRVIVGFSPDGKPIRKHREAKTEKEIKTKHRELLRERDKGIPAAGRRKMLIGDLIRDYVDNVMMHKPSTREHYDEQNYIKNRLIPAFGAIPIQTFDVSHMDEAYRSWMTDAHNPISAATVRRVHAILSAVFTSAMKRRRIEHDVTKLVTLPSGPSREETPFTVDEMRTILSTARSSNSYARWTMALLMGLRQGECLALRWQDLNLSKGEASIRHSLGRAKLVHACGGTCERRFAGDCLDRWSHGCGGTCGRTSAEQCRQRIGQEALVLGPTKSRRKHDTALPSEVGKALREHRANQDVLRSIAGEDWWDLDFVFTDACGRPIDPRSDYQAWQDLLKKAGLPPKKLHAARHSCGTFMAGIGIPMSTIKDAFGHSSIKVTERYVNTPREGLRWAMDQVDATFFGTPANDDEPKRTETETETAFHLLTFDQVVGTQSHEENWSRLGDLNPGPTHYECVALPLS